MTQFIIVAVGLSFITGFISGGLFILWVMGDELNHEKIN